MFVDPITIQNGSETTTLPRVAVGNMEARYRSGDGAFELNIAHSANKRERSVARITSNIVGEDPFDSKRTRNYTAQAYLVIDSPLNGVGFSDAELSELVSTLVDFLQQEDTVPKLLGKES